MRLHSAMMLSGESYDRRYIMAVSVQQSHPIAHLPLVLGVLRRLEVATSLTVLSPPTLHMGSRVVAGSKPWCSLFWMGIMPSTRSADGSKSVTW